MIKIKKQSVGFQVSSPALRTRVIINIARYNCFVFIFISAKCFGCLFVYMLFWLTLFKLNESMEGWALGDLEQISSISQKLIDQAFLSLRLQVANRPFLSQICHYPTRLKL